MPSNHMTKKQKPTIGPLDTVQRCRRELGRVYRACRYREVTPDELRAYIYALRTLAELIEVGEIEGRLTGLEAALERRQNAKTGEGDYASAPRAH